jgi:hypothetical protein
VPAQPGWAARAAFTAAATSSGVASGARLTSVPFDGSNTVNVSVPLPDVHSPGDVLLDLLHSCRRSPDQCRSNVWFPPIFWLVRSGSTRVAVFGVKVLGINAIFRDPAAALIVDGQMVAAAEEERFSRRKHGKRPVPFSANTSFNTAGRPMVDTPREAMELFGSAPVDLLAVGPFAAHRGNAFGGGR